MGDSNYNIYVKAMKFKLEADKLQAEKDLNTRAYKDLQKQIDALEQSSNTGAKSRERVNNQSTVAVATHEPIANSDDLEGYFCTSTSITPALQFQYTIPVPSLH